MGKVASFTVGLPGGPEVTIEPHQPLDVGDADEQEAAEQIRAELFILGIELAKSRIDCATVSVDFTYTYSGTIEVSLSDLDTAVEDVDDIQNAVERGDHYEVTDAISEDISDHFDDMYVNIDGVSIEDATDEDGEPV